MRQAHGVGAPRPVILSAVRDPRLVTIRRGGTLTDSDHHLLALWAAACAEHVLPLFESAHPGDRDRARPSSTPAPGSAARSR